MNEEASAATSESRELTRGQKSTGRREEKEEKKRKRRMAQPLGEGESLAGVSSGRRTRDERNRGERETASEEAAAEGQRLSQERSSTGEQSEHEG